MPVPRLLSCLENLTQVLAQINVTSIPDHIDAEIEVAASAMAPTNLPATNGATLALPVISKALSDAASDAASLNGGTKTPAPEEEAAK